MRSANLVDRHHDRHHVLAIHYGSRKHVLGLVLCEGIYEVTEVAVLEREAHFNLL